MKFKKFKKGFTLVELVVVIAVIAVLAAVSVGAYFGVTESANGASTTAGIKQVKDLWMLYVADEYDNNIIVFENNEELIAQDFCLRYADEKGFEFKLNYDLVTVYSGDIESQNGEENYNEGLLFSIETVNKSWILISDKVVLEESANNLKTNVAFNKSLVDSNRLILTDELTETLLTDETYVYPFRIEDVGTDATGKVIRGFKTYKVGIKKGDTIEYSYFRPGKGKNLVYADPNVKPSFFEIDGLSGSAPANYVTNANGNEVNVYDDVVLEEKEANSITAEDNLAFDAVISENEYSFYNYVVNKEAIYELHTITDGSDNLDTYDVAIVRFENLNEPEFDKTVISYNVEQKFTYSWSGRKYSHSIVKRTITHSSQATDTLKISYFATVKSAIDAINNEREDDTVKYDNYFVFLKNATIENDLIVPENTVLVVDHLINNTQDIIKYVTDNISFEKIKTETYVLDGDGKIVDQSINKDNAEEKITAAGRTWVLSSDSNNIELKYTIDYTKVVEGPNRLSGKADFDGVYQLDEYGNKMLDGDGNPILLNHTKDNFKRTDDVNINRLTIKNNSKLELSKNSYLLTESNIHMPESGSTLGISDRSEIVVEKGSSIELYDSKFKAYGEILGEGEINAYGTTEVVEFLKPQDFLGGSFTSSVVQNKVALFPFVEFIFDNIKCKTNFYNGTTWTTRTMFAMTGYQFISEAIDLYSPNPGSLFTPVNKDDSNTVFSKSYDLSTRTSTVEILGDVTDDNFQINFDTEAMIKGMINSKLGGFGGLASWFLGDLYDSVKKAYPTYIKADSYITPLPGVNIIIKENSSLTIDNENARFLVMPSSQINIYGELNITNGAQVALLSSDNVSEMLNINSENTFVYDYNTNQLLTKNPWTWVNQTRSYENLRDCQNNNLINIYGKLNLTNVIEKEGQESKNYSKYGRLYLTDMSYISLKTINENTGTILYTNESGINDFKYTFVTHTERMYTEDEACKKYFDMAAGINIDTFVNPILERAYINIPFINDIKR